jgi:chromosome segregation ATPase
MVDVVFEIAAMKKKLRSEIDELTTQWRTELDELDEQYDYLKIENEKLNFDIAELQEKVDTLETTSDDLEVDVKVIQNVINRPCETEAPARRNKRRRLCKNK